jgi:hypothetical protein
MKDIVVHGFNDKWTSEILADPQGPVLWLSVQYDTDIEAARAAEDEFRRLYPSERHFGPIMSGHIGLGDLNKSWREHSLYGAAQRSSGGKQ